MKNIIKKYKIVIICVCACFIVSCSDFLEMELTDSYSNDTYWTIASHATEGINACYRALNSADLFGSDQAPIFYMECLTPNAFHKDNAYNIMTYALGAHTGTTQGLNLITWRACYTGIGRCNNVIDNVPGIQMDENLKSRIIGEAKFLRAYFYWRLSVMFGGVPLVLSSPNNITEANALGSLPRATLEATVTQIITDLDDAIASTLAVRYPRGNANNGRASKGAALALKAKVLLQNHNYPGAVQACEAFFAANETITTAADRYGLYPDYNGLFRRANMGNIEVIFDVRWLYPTYTANYDVTHRQYQTQTPVQGLIDAYQSKNGKSIFDPTNDMYDPEDPFENRDPRLWESIMWIGRPWLGGTALSTQFFTTGYIFTKYCESIKPSVIASGTPDVDTTCPYIILRYADVLMMYAEALNETLSSPNQAVYDAVNAVRGRTGIEMPPLPEGLTKAQMTEAIRLERRIEFAGESYYYEDIRRWGIAQDVMNDAYVYRGNFGGVLDGGAIGGQRKFRADRDYLLPIPYTQIDLNPALVQNDNYN